MDKPKFSIVVPVYNAEGYLRKCLDSLLRQGLYSYEILLVNDGSTDSSLSICQEYAENNHRIKVLTQNNQGVCAARNNGLEHSTGEWIVLVDSDDYLLDNGLYTAFSAVKCQEEYDVIQYKSSYDFWSKKALTSDVIFMGSGHDLIRRSGFVSFCWLCFYRREFLIRNHIHFNNKYIVGEDQLFVANVFLHNPRTAVVSTDIYRYVVHEDSATTKRDVKHTRRCVEDYLSSFYDILSIAKSVKGDEKEGVVLACYNALNAKKMFGFSRMLSSQYDYRNFKRIRSRAREVEFYPIFPNGAGMKPLCMAWMINLILKHYFFYKPASWLFNSLVVKYILPRLRVNLKNEK